MWSRYKRYGSQPFGVRRLIDSQPSALTGTVLRAPSVPGVLGSRSNMSASGFASAVGRGDADRGKHNTNACRRPCTRTVTDRRYEESSCKRPFATRLAPCYAWSTRAQMRSSACKAACAIVEAYDGACSSVPTFGLRLNHRVANSRSAVLRQVNHS